ncbi:MAG: Rieske 2Fe-2S domain-containing protein, partial [Flavobacteriales bacterium]
METFFINPDIALAETLPPRFYQSQEVFEKLKETVFLKTWQWIGDTANTVPLTETVYPFVMLPDFLHEPLLLVRDKDDEVKCLSNVCTHRGNLVATNPGKAKGLT